MTYDEALSFIHSTDWSKTKPGLIRIRRLMALLGNPQDRLQFVHVAGTNGKGSCCKMLSEILKASGYKTGLFTSPYIERFNERFVIDGMQISDTELISLVEEIKSIVLDMDDKPTEFEIVTAIGMMWFERSHCDIVVLEVGMGGEFDSTNVINPPLVAMITTIGYDHMQYLGTTYSQIASAKAGIVKHGSDVIFYGDNKEAESVIRDKALSCDDYFEIIDRDKVKIISDTVDGLIFDYKEYKDVYIPMIGIYQAYNASLVIIAVERLRHKGYKISNDDIKKGFLNARWQGRFELIHKRPDIILDGGHNPEGIQSAIDSIKKIYPSKKIHFLVGMMADKDIRSMLLPTKDIAIDYVTVMPDNYRALSSKKLADILSDMGCKVYAATSIEDGIIKLINSMTEDDIACCIGSLYMVADIRKYVAITAKG